MTKEQAITEFWNSFGLPAYEENSIYSLNLKMPYITYELNTDSFGDSVNLSASLWYKSYSWLEINKKAREINEAIGTSGKLLDSDDGRIWIRRGHPFENRMGDDTDDTVKRIQLNINIDFYTNY